MGKEHKCDAWQCDFCEKKTCIECGGVMDSEGNCACAECQKTEKLKVANLDEGEW